jgi:aldehyde dehydrogenase
MAVSEQITLYPAPGDAGSPVTLKDRYDNFIGGHWVPPAEEAYSENPSPATGQPFCEVPRSTPHDIDLALDAAHAARERWGETSTTDRAAVLD